MYIATSWEENLLSKYIVIKYFQAHSQQATLLFSLRYINHLNAFPEYVQHRNSFVIKSWETRNQPT